MPSSDMGRKFKEAVIGKARSVQDPAIFHKLSLIAFFAWVGLGADGLSSSCYGPEEAFRILHQHPSLAVFVALATAATVFVISASYSQIIELFPSGGGGYIVASKLLSPTLGMVSGCALLIDYVLTITLSVASGTDALLSFLPLTFHPYKTEIALGFLLLLTVANLRGVKESVIPLVPVFIIFVLTHAFAILYAFATHLMNLPRLAETTIVDFQRSSSEIGTLGVILLILRAYSMGAGTYTGIEAVSNGMPILREPRVQTAKRTMQYMAISLAFTAGGLLLAYIFYGVHPETGKTFNAILFQNITTAWNAPVGKAFILVALISEAAILLIAAQTGFLDGPRVLANMALDRWFPNRFAFLSDRLVTHNGIILMASAAAVLMIFSRGSVTLLVVFYSINVFVTFFLSQAGMVRHWLSVRDEAPGWHRKATINGIGLVLTSFILVMVVILKFSEGGWITLIVTGVLVLSAVAVKRHYIKTGLLLRNINDFIKVATGPDSEKQTSIVRDSDASMEPLPEAQTAVLFVNGFNGLGLFALSNIFKLFGPLFKNYVFVTVGAVDAGSFKGTGEVDRLRTKVNEDLKKYVDFMNERGYYAEGIAAVGVDIVEEIDLLAPGILTKFPKAIFFGGQLEFPEHVLYTRWLHNYVTFALQKRFYHKGIPFVILPIRVPER